MMKRLILSIVAALPLMAADDLVGEYAAQVREVASGLVLNADHSFEYYFSYGAGDYRAKGTWRRDNDSVFLTTSGPELKPLRVLRTAAGTTGISRVFVLNRNGGGVQHMEVTVNGSAGPITARTSQDGVAEFRLKGSPKSVSVHVPVYDVNAGPFDIGSGHTDVWLEIDGDAITQLRFKDERLRVTDGSLEMTYWKGEKPLLYKKHSK